MIPPLRPRRGPGPSRSAAWLVLIALVAGCASSDAPDQPVGPDQSIEDDAAADDAAADDAGASPPVTPVVPSFGTDADALDATVVVIERSDDDGPDATVRVDARVAADAASRAQGLMGVEHLSDGAGMLFVYPDERAGAFWMKDTLIPLDIAFVAADGTVRAILTMQPCAADPCPVYDPEVEYLAALEVPAGWFAGHGIGVGSQATWPDPVPAGVVEP